MSADAFVRSTPQSSPRSNWKLVLQSRPAPSPLSDSVSILSRQFVLAYPTQCRQTISSANQSGQDAPVDSTKAVPSFSEYHPPTKSPPAHDSLHGRIRRRLARSKHKQSKFPILETTSCYFFFLTVCRATM